MQSRFDKVVCFLGVLFIGLLTIPLVLLIECIMLLRSFLSALGVFHTS